MLENFDTKATDEIILTTLDTLPGYDIDEHLGLVTGSAVRISNPLKEFCRKFKMVFSGQDQEFAERIKSARDLAVSNMVDEAKKLGANSIISIRFENSASDPAFIEVYVYGTAVRATKF